MSPKNNLTRRAVLVLAAMSAFAGPVLAAAARTQITVWKTPNCGCCKDWVKHLEANGFDAVTHDVKETASKRQALGLAEKYGSCHTATVNGYVLEGHVPARDIQRLLREKPSAIGLAVPGMPVGSPGMDMGTGADAFDVVLVLKDGSSRVFQSYAAKAA